MKALSVTALAFAAALTACAAAVEIPVQSDKPITLEAEQPGTPPHAPARIEWDESSGTLRLSYGGRVILDGRITGSGVKLVNVVSTGQGLEQRLTISGANLALRADVNG